MDIDDPLERSLKEVREDAELYLPKNAIATAILTAIDNIPFVGTGIHFALLEGRQRRTVERIVAVFEEVKKQLDQTDESKIDKEFFKSEEFGTILWLVIEQVQTTHDQEKLRMLAHAIANAGTKEFSQDHSKELYVRILRDLAPEHVHELHAMRPMRHPEPPHYVMPGNIVRDPRHGRLAVFQMLAALGLVDETLEVVQEPYQHGRGNRAAAQQLAKAISTPPVRCFKLSVFGMGFLDFLGAAEPELKANEK